MKNIFDIIKAIWDLSNGKKFNTGTMITLLSTSLLMLFSQLGLTQDQAGVYALYIVNGAGAVIMIVGYAHRLIKKSAATKV